MRALCTLFICTVFCAPAWGQGGSEIDPFRYVKADQPGCNTVNHAVWDGCNCICKPGRFWDTPTDYCQLESTMIPLWQAREMRGLENLPVEPNTCTELDQAEHFQDMMEYVENTHFDRDGDRWCPLGYDEDQDGCCLEHEFVGDISDCDDSDPEINPEAEEIMNDGIDNNCDHLIDALPGEQPIMMDSSYNGPAALDRDRDGYSEISDCDDLYAWANPGLHEICDDGIDNNCDTLIDEPDCMPGPNSVQDLHEAEEEDIEEDITESLDKISGSLISGEDDIPIIDLEEDVVEDTGQNTQGTSSNLINLAGADATFNNFPPGEVDQITAREHGWQLVTLPGDGVFIEEGTHSGNYLCLYPYRDDDQAYHPFISSLAINGIQLIPGEVYELSFSYRARTKREIVFVLRDEEGHPIGERTYEKLRKTRGNNWKRSTVHFTVADDVDLDQGTLSIGWGSLRKPLHLDNIYFRLVDEI